MRFQTIPAATAAIRAFETSCGSAYAYRFVTDCGGLFQVEIYGIESGALLGVL